MAEREPTEALSATKRALIELKDLRTRLARLERARNEPIAIVGLGCRYPGGVVDPASFWRLLREGRDAIREVPAERWDAAAFFDADVDAPGKMNTRFGGFLDGLELFDADLFGISPREAASMDPQQRLILEVAWEALEHAGQAPDGLSGSRTGVYVGVSTTDYTTLVTRAHDLTGIDVYLATGAVSHAVASGRLSYLLGLQGPAISLDTACSTSLVALHLGCQALRLEECDLALAGGVNAVLTPDNMVSLAKGRMLAPDGRCKPFAEAADGFARAEGAGMVVLKRLSDAQRDGDRIWAVVRGSAVNQDGRSQGLTAPNGPSQEAVIRAALERAGVAPGAVDYVEAHGTGTSLGDPIEIGALAGVFAPGRNRAEPLRVGSVKSNIGHAETAAGVAGLIKVVLMLAHRELAPSLHFTKPSPYIPWSELPIEVGTRLDPWQPKGGRARIAGVSSFGFSGTNAHVVLEEAPARESSEADERGVEVLVLSAKTEGALAELARRYEPVVEGLTGAELTDACWTANTGRAQLKQRVAVVGASGAELARALGAHRRGEPWPGLVSGHGDGAGKVAFLCTGQGPQYVGMGRELYRTLPVFRDAIDRCAAAVEGELPEPLLEVMHPGSGREEWAAERLSQTLYTQPALFAVEWSLAQLWRWLGVEPDVVLGHSSGEFVAAALAGVFGAEDGMRLSLERGRLMQRTPVGEMMAVRAGEGVVSAEVMAEAGRGGQVSVAAVNGPENVVVSGEGGAVRRVAARLEGQGIETKTLAVKVGGHSPLMDGVLAEFEAAAGRVAHGAPELEVVSNVTGEVMRAGEWGGAYWRRHMREPVRFAAGMAKARALGCSVFVEVGPRPVLLGMGQLTVSEEGTQWLPSLRPERGEWTQLLESAAAYWASGREVDWGALEQGQRRNKVALPTYPFQRKRHWAVPEGVRWNAPLGARPRAGVDDELSRLVYEVDWIADPTTHAAPIPGPAQIVSALGAASAAPAGAAEPASRVLSALDDLATSYALGALRELGLTLAPGQRLSGEQLVGELGIADRHRLYVERLLTLLGERGVLDRQGQGWSVARSPEENGQRDAGRRLTDAHPEHRHEVALLDRCGAELAAVLRGERDPLQVLFPEGAMDAAEGVYRDSPFSRAYNATIREVVAQVAAQFPTGQELRILEVGAGTGGTTAEILPLLGGRAASYTFTDVSPGFAAHAKGRFDRFGFVDYRVLDVERPPEEQGFEPGRYHVVIAANVIHTTRELRATLAHVRRLLAPGGLLVLLEVTTPRAWIDVVFGMTPGWWRFADADLRTEHPLLPERAWIELLNGSGFVDAAAAPSPASGWGEGLQSVLIARADPAAAAPVERADGTWIVVHDRSGVAAHVARGLEARGARVVTAEMGSGADVLANAAGTKLRGVIDLGALRDGAAGEPEEGVAAAARTACARVVALLRALVAQDGRDAEGGGRLWVATRRAQPAPGLVPDPAGLAGAPLWGLGRVAALEHPEHWGGLIDLEGGPAEAEAQAIVETVLGAGREDQVAVRGGTRWLARLAPRATAPAQEAIRIRSDASYMVTGGLGSLGLHVASWLVERGARHLLLVGRTGLSGAVSPPLRARRERIVRELEGRGAAVHVVQADVGDAAAMEHLFAEINASHPPLRGIVHAAGVAWARPLAELSESDLEAVFEPKVEGAWNLHVATERLGLDFFVLFSSAAATWGSAELAHYAAANQFLDALAHHRAGKGLPALAVDWGRWEGEGMTSEVRHEWLGKIGMDAFGVREGLGALGRLLDEGATQATVARMDWGLFKPIYEAKARGPLLERMGAADAAATKAPTTARDVLGRLRQAPEAERPAILDGYLQSEVAAVMGLSSPVGIERHRPLLAMGMDSLMAVQLRNRLQSDLEVTLPIQRLMESGGLAELEGELLAMVSLGAPGAAAPAQAAEILAGIDQLSAGEVDALLRQLLEESGGKE